MTVNWGPIVQLETYQAFIMLVKQYTVASCARTGKIFQNVDGAEAFSFKKFDVKRP